MSEKDVPFPYQPLIEGIEKFITDRKVAKSIKILFSACHLEIRIIITHNNTKRKIAHHYETYKEPYRSFLEEKQTGNISYCIPIDEQCLLYTVEHQISSKTIFLVIRAKDAYTGI